MTALTEVSRYVIYIYSSYILFILELKMKLDLLTEYHRNQLIYICIIRKKIDACMNGIKTSWDDFDKIFRQYLY